MAATFKGTEYTVTASAASLTAILGGTRHFLNHLVMRAGTSNAGSVFVGLANVTVAANRLIYLAAGESFAIALEGPYFSSDDIYVIGTAADKLHIILLQ